MNSQLNTDGWRSTGVGVSLLLVVVLFLYRDTVLYLVGIWNQLKIGEYAHGYLVVAISLYLVYRQRRVLSGLTPCPSITALPVIAAAALLWLMATLVDVMVLQPVALLLLILSVIWAGLGPRITRHLLLPVLFIGFALPIWSSLSVVLQQVTTDVVFWLARFSEVPVMRQDHVLILPSGQLSVEEACSGLRYLLAALTLGVLYAYLNYSRLSARVLVVLVAAAAAILANILRVFIVVYLAYVTRMQHPLVHDHLNLGWMLFGGLVFLLLLLDLGFSRPVAGADPTDADIAPAVRCKHGPFGRAMLFVASLLLIASAPVLARWAQQSLPVAGDTRLFFPTAVQGWSGPSETRDDWMPEYHGAVADLRAYHRDGDEVYVYIGYYPRQSQGRELINELNRIANDGVWQTEPRSERAVSVDDRPVLERVIISPTGKQRLVWYWYRVGGRQTTNRYMAKALEVLGLVTGRHQAFVTAVAVDIVTGENDAKRLLHDFVSVMEQPIARMMDGNGAL